MKRLMIVADNSFAAQSVRLALRQTAGFQVIGFVDGSVPISSKAAELAPDIVVVDDTQEPEHAIARLEELAALLPAAKRVFLTMRMDDERARAGLRGRRRRRDLEDRASGEPRHAAARDLARRRGPRPARRPPASRPRNDCPLTDRELEILRLVAQGYTNGRIARELWVTEQTVKFHLSNTYRKLGVANRTEASRYAHLNDLMAAA